MTVGDRIRQVRIEKDITQQELADCAGVSKQAVYKYENNIVTNIPMDKLSLIASKLGVTPCFLMGWEDNNSVPEVPDTIKAALQQEDGKVQRFPVGIRQGFYLLNDFGIIFRFHALASPFL